MLLHKSTERIFCHSTNMATCNMYFINAVQSLFFTDREAYKSCSMVRSFRDRLAFFILQRLLLILGWQSLHFYRAPHLQTKQPYIQTDRHTSTAQKTTVIANYCTLSCRITLLCCGTECGIFLIFGRAWWWFYSS